MSTIDYGIIKKISKLSPAITTVTVINRSLQYYLEMLTKEQETKDKPPDNYVNNFMVTGR